ncbi:hypothetical protein PIB30_073315 [Stylosanthes scabra]|uniref:Uncharacterized protein n=1 Tax=Stylosanthes scabra TaxID=79078 RepID=A0ABU6RPB0_9FABA|nr:hypothetical protein [Stylosanthes scabra]
MDSGKLSTQIEKKVSSNSLNLSFVQLLWSGCFTHQSHSNTLSDPIETTLRKTIVSLRPHKCHQNTNQQQQHSSTKARGPTVTAVKQQQNSDSGIASPETKNRGSRGIEMAQKRTIGTTTAGLVERDAAEGVLKEPTAGNTCSTLDDGGGRRVDDGSGGAEDDVESKGTTATGQWRSERKRSDVRTAASLQGGTTDLESCSLSLYDFSFPKP